MFIIDVLANFYGFKILLLASSFLNRGICKRYDLCIHSYFIVIDCNPAWILIAAF